jgi:hypothetical protein
VIVSITGGANTLKLAPRLEDAIRKGVAALGRDMNALLIDGGSASGVMALTGEAMRLAGSQGLVLMGFASWNCMVSRDLLEGNAGEPTARRYVQGVPNHRDGAGLDPGHTHFVLVDAGPGSGWGAELPLRTGVTKLVRCRPSKLGAFALPRPQPCRRCRRCRRRC